MGFVQFAAAICSLLVAFHNAYGSSSKFDNFYSWFKRNGGSSNGVGIADFGEMGQGIIAVKNISSEQDILKVPQKIIFSMASLSKSNDPAHVYLTQVLEPEDAVVVAVMLEKIKGKTSFFEPYIATLPEYIPSLIHFSKEELGLLQDESLMKSALNYYNSKVQSFQKMQSIFANANLETVPISSDLIARMSLDSFLWATTVVDSRGLRFKGKVYLAPFTDFFNYKPHPNFRKSEAGKFYLDHHKLSSSKLVVSADRSQVAGQQVFEDYGDNDDKIYATYHGFIPHENPFRCVTVVGAQPSAMPSIVEKFLKSLQFSYSPGSCVLADGQLSRALEVYLTVSAFDEEDIHSCEGHVERITRENKPIGEVYEACGLGLAYTAAMKLLFDSKQPNFNVLQLSADSNALSLRILQGIRSAVDQSKSKLWTTTISEDELLLHHLNDQIVTETNVATKHHLTHSMLAVRYRIAMKRHHAILLEKYSLPTIVDPRRVVEEIDVNVDANPQTAPFTTETIPTEPASNEELIREVEEFNNWFNANGAVPNKLKAAVMPIYRIGTLASADITAEEIYLGVPETIILDVDKAVADTEGLGRLISALKLKYKNRDSFHELLFFLLQEKFVRMGSSFYWPYLRLLPGPTALDIPLLWTDEQINERLTPSAIYDQVMEYRQRLKKTFDFLNKVELITNYFPASVFTWENYLWANAILDSRAIWWKGERHLVPMLDFVNCKEGPDPTRVHSTSQSFSESGVVMAITKAPWTVLKGEQVFENYGQPNHIYFMYHGFVLTAEAGGNSHDCVHVQFTMTPEEIARITDFEKSKEIAQKLGLRNFDKHTFCLDSLSGIVDSTWFYLTVKLNENLDSFRQRKGKPSAEVKTYFQSYLTSRIEQYEHRNTSHFMSSLFLKSELVILERVLQEMAN